MGGNTFEIDPLNISLFFSIYLTIDIFIELKAPSSLIKRGYYQFDVKKEVILHTVVMK